jgi:hypothetical protein
MQCLAGLRRCCLGDLSPLPAPPLLFLKQTLLFLKQTLLFLKQTLLFLKQTLLFLTQTLLTGWRRCSAGRRSHRRAVQESGCDRCAAVCHACGVLLSCVWRVCLACHLPLCISFALLCIRSSVFQFICIAGKRVFFVSNNASKVNLDEQHWRCVV